MSVGRFESVQLVSGMRAVLLDRGPRAGTWWAKDGGPVILVCLAMVGGDKWREVQP